MHPIMFKVLLTSHVSKITQSMVFKPQDLEWRWQRGETKIILSVKEANSHQAPCLNSLKIVTEAS